MYNMKNNGGICIILIVNFVRIKMNEKKIVNTGVFVNYL